MPLCKTPAQLRASCIRPELGCTDPFSSAERFQPLTTCSAARKYKAEPAVVAEQPHCFGNCMLLVGQAERTRIVHHQRPFLERRRNNLAPVGPVFRDKNLVLGNA